MRFLTILFFILAASLLYIPHYAEIAHGTRSTGEAAIGGAFTLTDQTGRPVSDTEFRGRLMLVYMGYTHCPDICPMTLATLSELLKKLGPDSARVAVLFISLDPARDTPRALGDFLNPYDSRIVGLTGSEADIQKAMSVYKVYGRKNTTDSAQHYRIDHSGFLYLMDARGKYITHFPADVKAETLAEAAKKAM